MAHSASGVKVLTWYDCQIVGEKATYSAKFLCTSETEAQLKCIGFLRGEGDTLVSCKATPTAPVGSVYTMPAQQRPVPPWYDDNATRQEPRGEIVPERKGPSDEEKLEALKKHLGFVPINVETKLYTYKAEETNA